jgi:hypothetical protein
MGVLPLGFLFVVIIPLVEGVLLALLLREVHIRHPLPLGGAIVPRWWNPPQSESVPAHAEQPAEVAVSEPDETANTENSPEGSDAPPADAAPADLADEPKEPLHSGVSVFDGTEKIPGDLPVSNVLEAMTSGGPAAGLNDFERIIEDAANPTISVPEEAHADDGMNQDDLAALEEALPGTKIDFSQELDTNSHISEPISPTAKELLGENFDYDALEQQAAENDKQPFKFLVPVESTSKEEVKEEAENLLDVQEDESGTVQVSSPFTFNTDPLLADFAVPQTILPMFSGDWIQETNSTAECSEEEATKFCFAEESRPMFVRKKSR